MLTDEFTLSTRITMHGKTIGDLVDAYVRLIQRAGPLEQDALFDIILRDWRVQIDKQFSAEEVVGNIVRYIAGDPRMKLDIGVISAKQQEGVDA